jgi:arginase family enzyme
MNRSIAIVGAPTSIGIRTYDSGEPRQLDRAPGVLRELGLVQRLGASDLGDVIPFAYRDYVCPAGRVRNEAEVGAYCRTLGERVKEATSDGRFAIVLGCECSIMLGSLLGARKSAQGSVGLVSSMPTLTSGRPKSLAPVRWPACASPLPSDAWEHLWLGSLEMRPSCMARMSF